MSLVAQVNFQFHQLVILQHSIVDLQVQTAIT